MNRMKRTYSIASREPQLCHFCMYGLLVAVLGQLFYFGELLLQKDVRKKKPRKLPPPGNFWPIVEPPCTAQPFPVKLFDVSMFQG